jgi:hypothetical protein
MSARRDDFDTKMKETRRKLRARGRQIRALTLSSGTNDELLAEAESRVMSVRQDRVRSRRRGMARTTGGDLIVQLMHEVAQLKEQSSETARRVEALERRAIDFSGEIHALGIHLRNTDATITRIGTILAQHVANTDGRFDEVNRRLDAAEQAVRAFSKRA